MSLKPILDSLEGLHEEVAKLYTKKDGKFVLDVEDSGLKSALQKERDAREAAEKALKARDESEAAEKAKKEREDLERKGEYEKLSAADKARIAELEDNLKKSAAEAELKDKKNLAISLFGQVAVNERALDYLTAQFMDSIELVQGVPKVKGAPEKDPKAFASEMQADPLNAPFLRGIGASGGGAGQSGAVQTGIHARHDELSKKATLTSSESIELVKLAGQIESEPKPKP